MKNWLLLLLFWTGFLGVGFAQQNWPPVYEIRSDSAMITLDTMYYQIAEDKQGNFSFEQIQRNGSFYTDSYYNPNRKSHTYWIRMRLKNSLSHTLNLYVCDFSGNYLDLYWLDSAKRWQHNRTGDLLPESQLPDYNGNKERARLLLRLAPGQETTIYQRSQKVFWQPPLTYIAPRLQSEEDRIREVFKNSRVRQDWKGYFFDGTRIGILLLACCYNLLVFFSTREKVYLYFSICLLFFTLDRNNYNIQLTLFEEQPYLFKLLSNFFFIVFFVFFIQSIRKFIRPEQTLPRLNRATSLFLGLTMAINVIPTFIYKFPDLPVRELNVSIEVLVRIVYGCCLVMTIKRIREGVTDARFLLIAITPLFIFWAATLIFGLWSVYFKIASPDLIRSILGYGESICLAWLVLAFSWALINRYNLIRRQVIQQAIEREQLEKEREIERSRLIESQNELLEKQVRQRTAELQQSLETVRATQSQLIQKEKMASLGELTAGIAHEIQNPLNFVNNFSEVNSELIDELKEEFEKEPLDKEYIQETLNDLDRNQDKIVQHGQRASNIVKGMLEHSRHSTGQKQPTDLNALVDEYLRLAYHGFRAKDKGFNAELVTNFDPGIAPTDMVAQDMGRVFLNLFNNAFYTVADRQKKQASNEEVYQPTVSVSTEQQNGHLVIRVSDNGLGIPEAIKTKIFQPFFTTKPTGEGTGLGLSLSYDIVTQGHGGSFNVESQEGKGTEFSIVLPI